MPPGEAGTQEPPCPQQYQNGESEESHEQLLKALQNAVTTFVNRMKSNHMRGRSITNDSAVLSLFQSISSTHPQLLELLNQLDERRRGSRGPRGVDGQAAPAGGGSPAATPPPQCTTRGCRTSWRRSGTPGVP